MITANLRGNTITLRQVLLQRIVYEELKMVQTRVLQTWTYNTGPPLTHLFFSLHKVQEFLLLGKLHFSFQNLTPSVWHIPTAWRASSRTWLVKRRHWCHRSVPAVIMPLLSRTGTHWMLLELWTKQEQKWVPPNVASPSMNLYLSLPHTGLSEQCQFIHQLLFYCGQHTRSSLNEYPVKKATSNAQLHSRLDL